MKKQRLSKHVSLEQLHYKAEDLRWATPEIVANYRAQRLKCQTIADLGCGIGFQTLAFAKVCQKVYAVDKDQEKIQRAQHNAEALGLSNIIFIVGDILSKEVIAAVKDAEIFFCDPERLPEEKERNLETITPNLKKLVQQYSKLSSKLAVELPPQIKKVPFAGEKEYLSLERKLNRLTWYSKALSKGKRSAVILPSKEILYADTKAELLKSRKLQAYLYEVDPAVVKAGLLAELSTLTSTSFYAAEKAAFFTGAELIKSPFFVHTFKILGITTWEDSEIKKSLQDLSVGTVLIRWPVPPDQYWKIKNKLESSLSGTKKVSLFKLQGQAVVGEEV